MAKVDGIFTERREDAHLEPRREALEASTSLPVVPVTAEIASSPAEALARARPALAERGAAVVHLDRPFNSAEFLGLGRLLGEPIGETIGSLSRVDDSFVLHLRSSVSFTSDAARQPFSTSPLTLHSEGSRRPLDAQPRYIVLLCHEPGGNTSAAQTVLTPMDAVAAALDPETQSILRRTSFRETCGRPMILREEGVFAVFSFRDFGEQPLAWTYHGCPRLPSGAAAVDDAIRRLLTAMYTPELLTGITWQRGTLAIIDNRRVFHGRTAGLPVTTPPFRHLTRLRIR